MVTSREIISRYGLKEARKIEIPDMDRYDLADLFRDLGYTEGVEIGTERAVYAVTLAQSNPNLHLTCVDPWKAYSGYREHVTQDKLDGFYEETVAKLAPFNVSILREFSIDAAKQFEDRSLDFIYLDANHELSHFITDLAAWTRKVRPGGIVAGHDYIKRKDNGYLVHVMQGLDAWTDAFFIRPLFICGRKDYREGEKRDSPRSWFWVVE